MLLVLDYYIEGPVRERLLVAYFRYSGEQHSNESKFEDIVQLLRSTEFSRHQGKRLAKYPESFFRYTSGILIWVDPIFSSKIVISTYIRLVMYLYYVVYLV